MSIAVTTVLAAGCNVITLFKEMVRREDTMAIKAVIDHPSFPHYKMLCWACKHKHADAVKLLLEDGRVDPTAGNNNPIQLVSQAGSVDVVRLLLEDNRVNPAGDNNFALRCMCSYGHVDVVKLLLEDDRVDPGAYNNASIRLSSQNGHDAVVKLLLEDGRANPAVDNNLALRRASQNGHDAVVKLLLEDDRVDPGACNNASIRLASQNGHTCVVEILTNHAKPPCPGKLLLEAMAKNWVKVVRLCLKKYPQETISMKEEIITWALEQGHEDIILSLMN